jgi:hypothetical protein
MTPAGGWRTRPERLMGPRLSPPPDGRPVVQPDGESGAASDPGDDGLKNAVHAVANGVDFAR